jgi:hypothetical protein
MGCDANVQTRQHSNPLRWQTVTCTMQWLSILREMVLCKFSQTEFPWVYWKVINFAEKVVLQSLAFESTFIYLDYLFISVLCKQWWKYWHRNSQAFWEWRDTHVSLPPSLVLSKIRCLICTKHCWINYSDSIIFEWKAEMSWICSCFLVSFCFSKF